MGSGFFLEMEIWTWTGCFLAVKLTGILILIATVIGNTSILL